MLCMINFTTANIYNVHEHTLTCDLKNYMNPLRNINSQVPVEKVLRSSLEVLKTDRTFWICMVAEHCHYIFSDLFKKYYIKPIIFKAIVKTKYDLN